MESFAERLNDWAARSMGMISTSGASDTWGDESSFAAAVFVLCRRVVQWKLTDRQEGTKVLADLGAENCAHPMELLQLVLRKVLQEKTDLAEILYRQAIPAGERRPNGIFHRTH